jgi:hypothetical protein
MICHLLQIKKQKERFSKKKKTITSISRINNKRK